MDDSAYLTAKRTVDDRALNRRVLDRFASALTDCNDSEDRREDAVRVLEVGAGTGTMVARLARWDLLPERASYRLVDRERAHVERAFQRVPTWLEAAGYRVELADQSHEDRLGRLHARTAERELTVSFEVADAFDIGKEEHSDVDAIVACAFFDLVDLPAGAVALFELLREGGLLYAPITFDGVTGFVPAHPLDEQIEHCYHRHMELRDQPGDPNAGRTLLESISEAGGELLATGGADWLVRPTDGVYPHDERLVLDSLLSTITESVAAVTSGEPGPEFSANHAGSEALDTGELEQWASLRREQLDSGQLLFLAHNLDVLAVSPTK